MTELATFFARDCALCIHAPGIPCAECGEMCAAAHVVADVTSRMEGGGAFDYPVWPSGAPGVGMPAWQVGSRSGQVIVEAIAHGGAVLSEWQVPDARRGVCLHCHRRVAANVGELERRQLALKALGDPPRIPTAGGFVWGIVGEKALAAFMPGFLIGFLAALIVTNDLHGTPGPFPALLAWAALAGIATSSARGWRHYVREDRRHAAELAAALAAAERWEAQEEAAERALAELEGLDPRDPTALFVRASPYS